MPGQGEHAEGPSRGTVVVPKDGQTLAVEATALPSVFGSDEQKRTDPAYEIASDVLGCWAAGRATERDAVPGPAANDDSTHIPG